jgi:hypothetical protein
MIYSFSLFGYNESSNRTDGLLTWAFTPVHKSVIRAFVMPSGLGSLFRPQGRVRVFPTVWFRNE